MSFRRNDGRTSRIVRLARVLCRALYICSKAGASANGKTAQTIRRRTKSWAAFRHRCPFRVHDHRANFLIWNFPARELRRESPRSLRSFSNHRDAEGNCRIYMTHRLAPLIASPRASTFDRDRIGRTLRWYGRCVSMPQKDGRLGFTPLVLLRFALLDNTSLLAVQHNTDN